MIIFSTEGSSDILLALKRNLLTTSQSGISENAYMFMIVPPDPFHPCNFKVINSKHTYISLQICDH